MGGKRAKGEAVAKLTTKTIETIKPTAVRQEIPDALLPGLYLVVQPSGARSFAVRYRTTASRVSTRWAPIQFSI
jgi:hypothetical protein